jgi:hypothetical protein
MSTLPKQSWLCTQGRCNPEVVTVFGATTRYRRATVGSSHDDVHTDNSALHTGAVRPHTALHTGAVRPHTGFVGSPFFISPCTGHGSSPVFEILPALWRILDARGFRAAGDTTIFFSGPAEAKGNTSVLSRRAGSSGIPWRLILSLVKKTLHRHREGFEPQCVSSFMSSLVYTPQKQRGIIGVPSTPALAHAPPTHKAHRAPNHTLALFTVGLARNARAYTSARGIGFCAIWVCISSSSSSHQPH